MFCQVHAQSNGIHIELIGPEQGLPNRNIKCISQDTIGFIWIGTSTELLRYDGYHFENFTYLLDEKNTSSIIINDIKSDRKGYLWIAHANGITVIDPHTLSSRQVTIQKKFPGKLKAPFAMRIFFFCVCGKCNAIRRCCAVFSPPCVYCCRSITIPFYFVSEKQLNN